MQWGGGMPPNPMGAMMGGGFGRGMPPNPLGAMMGGGFSMPMFPLEDDSD